MSGHEVEMWQRQLLEAALALAWMRRCGPGGQPGEWLRGQGLEVDDKGEAAVEAYPSYALVEDGEPVRFSWFPRKPYRTDAWDWRLDWGWDGRGGPITKEQADLLKSVGGCVDRTSASFHVLGSHQERPEVPDSVVKAVVALNPGGAS